MKKIKKQIDLSYIGGLCLMLALILVLYCMVAAYGSKADDSSIKNVSNYDGYIGKTWVNAGDSGHAVLEMLSPEEIAVKVTYAERAEENQNNMERDEDITGKYKTFSSED